MGVVVDVVKVMVVVLVAVAVEVEPKDVGVVEVVEAKVYVELRMMVAVGLEAVVEAGIS